MPLAETITRVSHDVSTSGMSTAFFAAAIVALVGVFVALLTRRPEEHDLGPPGAPSPAPATEAML